MLFIQKRKIVVILLFSFVLILATAIWAYIVGSSCGIKSNSELVLFLGFIFAGLQLIASITLLLYSRRKQRDFFSLMEVIKSGGILSEEKAKRIGNIGLELKSSLMVAHDITAKKSLKIANLNGLLKALVECIKDPVLVVNLNGEIMDASPAAKEKIEFKPELNLSDCLPSLSIKEAFKEASATHLPVEQGNQIIFFPVFSTIGDISYFLVDISKESALANLVKVVKPEKPYEEIPKKQRRNFFDRFKN